MAVRSRILAGDGSDPQAAPAGHEQHSSDNTKKVVIIVVCLVAFIIIKSGNHHLWPLRSIPQNCPAELNELECKFSCLSVAES